MKYTINTRVNNFKIEQDVITDFESHDLQANIVRRVIDTQEYQVRQALISMGWAPPEEVNG